ncbi:MAG: TolB-like protein/cytochrome c-type biogenesis protein CcmH/NrfG [Planctomycetaceae bacterium]|jgi:TolB-like protein/cytochrome c-type biogenesis protein CcmH/NrfG
MSLGCARCRVKWAVGRVIRVATLYVVAIWPIIQLLDIISPTLELPDSVLRYLVIAFFAGLPFALILSWVFDLDKDGVLVDDGESHEPMLGSRKDFAIVGSLCVLVVVLFFVQMGLEGEVAIASVDLDASPSNESVVEIDKVSDVSIAVKPFDSFSSDPRDQYFADGLSEELLNVLARVPELRVAARTSSFAYKGVNRNISDIGRELSVAHILEGSVRANDIDNTIRVTAQLINVESGQHVWSETYTYEYSDVFKIQDDISKAVAEKLKVSLFTGQAHSLRSRGARSSNPEALIAYGRGQQELSKRSEESLLAAASYFETAVTEDPNFASAFAGLSDAHSLLANYMFADREESLARARQAVDKSLELDPELGVAWASKGLLESQYHDRNELARTLLQKAMQLNPSYAMAVMWYASLVEDEAEKVTLYERAVKLDPKSPVAAFNLASRYAALGRDAEVMTLFSQMVESDPNYSKGYELVAKIASRNGQIGEAIGHYKRAYELGKDLNHALDVSKLYADIGDFENSDVWFDKLKDDVPDGYQTRVLWFRLGRYVAANDLEGSDRLLDKIAADPSKGLEASFNSIFANYYLDNRETMVRDYESTLASGEIFAKQDEYTHEFELQVKIAVADQMKAEGLANQSEELLSAAETSLKKNIEDSKRHWPEDWYMLAQISAVRGQQRQALIQLQRAVDEGWREHWRPAVDPMMSELKSDQTFQVMMAGLENRLAIIRDQFQMEAEFAMGY